MEDYDREFLLKVKALGERFHWNIEALRAAVQQDIISGNIAVHASSERGEAPKLDTLELIASNIRQELDCDCTERMFELIDQLDAALNCFSAGQRSVAAQWISVKERLPDYGDYVLVFVTDDMEGNKNFVQDNCREKTLESEAAWSDGTITHWQALPSPPTVVPQSAEDASKAGC
jgi:hypothetical protein